MIHNVYLFIHSPYGAGLALGWTLGMFTAAVIAVVGRR